MVKMIPNHVYGEGKVASPTDYVAVGISALTIFILLCGTFFAHLIHGVPEIKKKQVQLFVLQTIASIIFLLSLVISLNLIKSKHRHIWHSCYLWTVWLGGPCGFGLLMSCRIAQAHRLYYLFVKRRLPPIKPYQLVPLILIPWVGIAARVWIAIYVANEVHHEKTASLMVASRFTLMLTANVMVLSFFFMSMSRPLFNQLSMRKRESDKFETMGQVLGIPDSGLLFPTGLPLNLDEPIEKLLEQKKFRHSFMAFADSRMAGESVHFYDEVHELNKIPITDTARRIYLSGHIIEQHISVGMDQLKWFESLFSVGSPMEINISHQMRQEVLNTTDLAHPDLFKHAINEMVQLMRMNLEKDYWSSPFYLQFKEEIKAEVEVSEPLENITSWNCSPKVSSVNAVDDPFHQDSLTKNSEAQYQFSLQINKDSAEETSSQSSQTNFLSSSRCSFANFSSNKRGWS
ncbi:regulator of G-protein signaling 1 isoform X3 [Cryptomeria japonica]|uniref:regulator of G-protein signaling 1 isoform X3 n=1 Tax=Cryptomeria japonica TaxID=3369 RepID=UPI0027DA8918|nr:regulator of G-protein signaling 1 isoform X3 [Cryptomeria japonica]